MWGDERGISLDIKVVIFLVSWDLNKGLEKPFRMEAKRNRGMLIFKPQTQVAKWKRKAMKATITEL
jgi:hypothetical protein